MFWSIASLNGNAALMTALCCITTAWMVTTMVLTSGFQLATESQYLRLRHGMRAGVVSLLPIIVGFLFVVVVTAVALLIVAAVIEAWSDSV